MNSKENSTGTTGGATGTCLVPVAAIDGVSDVIDRIDGLTSKSQAAKHLSSLLLRLLEQKLGPDAGKPTNMPGCREIMMNESQWYELQWLASEVWDSCGRVVSMLDELDRHAIELSNAQYQARQAVAK